MGDPKATVDYYVSMYLEGGWEDAYHGLIDLDPDLVPELIAAYESSDDQDLQAFIIRAVTQFRLESSVGFLEHALSRDEERIWKRALDGLVTAESVKAIDAMEHVLSSVTETEKREWIQEAIGDTKVAVKNKQNKTLDDDA